MKREVPVLIVTLMLGALGLLGCDAAENPLAPYEGARPFILQQVTQSFAPDVQWVGGRAAAVGVNRGSKAALDSTLVWLVTAEDNSLSAPMSVGGDNDEDAVRGYGGTPVDSLASGQEYTFWIANEAALAAGLSGVQADSFSFRDTTFTLNYALRGRSGGDPQLGVSFQILRDQKLTADRYIIYWTPNTVGFRQVALVKSSTGGFTNLVWHVVLPDSVQGTIQSPVILGQTPDGADEIVPWVGSFELSAYTLWATTSDWTRLFTSTAPGYAFFQVFPSNFQ